MRITLQKVLTPQAIEILWHRFTEELATPLFNLINSRLDNQADTLVPSSNEAFVWELEQSLLSDFAQASLLASNQTAIEVLLCYYVEHYVYFFSTLSEPSKKQLASTMTTDFDTCRTEILDLSCPVTDLNSISPEHTLTTAPVEEYLGLTGNAKAQAHTHSFFSTEQAPRPPKPSSSKSQKRTQDQRYFDPYFPEIWYFKK